MRAYESTWLLPKRERKGVPRIPWGQNALVTPGEAPRPQVGGSAGEPGYAPADRRAGGRIWWSLTDLKPVESKMRTSPLGSDLALASRENTSSVPPASDCPGKAVGQAAAGRTGAQRAQPVHPQNQQEARGPFPEVKRMRVHAFLSHNPRTAFRREVI